MSDITVVIKNYANASAEQHYQERIIKYSYKDFETFSNLLKTLDLQNDPARIVNGGPLYNVFDYLYTDSGIKWHVNIDDAKLSDFKRTFPNEDIDIRLSEDGMGAAGDFSSEWLNPVLIEVFKELIITGIVITGGYVINKIRFKYNNRKELGPVEINDFLMSLADVREPSVFYDSIYNREAWTLSEISDLFRETETFSRQILIGMGYVEVNNSKVFKIDYNKKQEFIRESKRIEEETIRKLLEQENEL